MPTSETHRQNACSGCDEIFFEALDSCIPLHMNLWDKLMQKVLIVKSVSLFCEVKGFKLERLEFTVTLVSTTSEETEMTISWLLRLMVRFNLRFSGFLRWASPRIQ